jgi:hypothetical protein
MEAKDTDPAVGAYYDFQADKDELVLAWIQEDFNEWYPNLPDPVVMGMTKVPKVDYVSGLYRAIARPVTSTNKQTGASFVGPPQLNISVPQQRGTGNFPPLLAFDATRTEISPLEIGRECTAKSIYTSKHMYLMPDKLGWTTDLVQAMKTAEGKLTACAMDASDDALAADIEAANNVDWDQK